MKTLKLVDADGLQQTAYLAENQDDIKSQLDKDRKQNLKEHLYIGYLIIGTIAFTLGILISLKRLKSK